MKSLSSCWSYKYTTLLLSLLGVLLIILSLLLPTLIKNMINTQLCTQLCVPNYDDTKAAINNWLYNTNEAKHPPEYYQFYLYNITNTGEIVEGKKAIVHQLGPYTYRYWTSKFNVERFYDEATNTFDNSKIGYEVSEKFEFVQYLSPGVSENDYIVSFNLAFTAGLQASYWMRGCILPALNSCSDPNFIATFDLGFGACLFTKLNPRQMILEQVKNGIIGLGDLIFYGGNRLDPNFKLFYSTDTTDASNTLDHVGHNFGMGGNCTQTTFNPPTWISNQTQCNAPGLDNTDVLWIQKTGQSSVQDLGSIVSFLGNTTIENIWNGPEEVRGGNKYNFHPSISRDETLSIWHDLLYRNVELDYVEDSSVKGIDTYLFRSSPSIWAGKDPHYNYINHTMPQGLMNISSISQIRYGTPSMLYASSPHFYNADKSVSDSVNCTNCPTPDQMTMKTHISTLQIEPMTGAVVQGAMYGQMNVKVGQNETFNNEFCDQPQKSIYSNITDAYIPYLWFRYSANLTDTVADSIKPSLSQLSMALTFIKVAIYGFSSIGAVFLLAAVYVYLKNGVWKAKENSFSLNGDENESYSSLPENN